MHIDESLLAHVDDTRAVQRAVLRGHGRQPARLRHRRGRAAHARHPRRRRACRWRRSACSPRCIAGRGGRPAGDGAAVRARARRRRVHPVPHGRLGDRLGPGERRPQRGDRRALLGRRGQRRVPDGARGAAAGPARRRPQRRRLGARPTGATVSATGRSCSSASRPGARSPCSRLVALRERGELGDRHRRHRRWPTACTTCPADRASGSTPARSPCSATPSRWCTRA